MQFLTNHKRKDLQRIFRIEGITIFFLVANVLCVFIIFIAILYGYKLILFLFAPFILGYLISKILKPLVILYRDKFKFRHEFSSGLALITFIFVVVYVLSWLVHSVATQIGDVYDNSEVIIQNFTYAYDRFSMWYKAKINILPEAINEPVKNFVSILTQGILEATQEHLKEVPEKTLNFSKKLFSITLIGIISSFFFMKYSDLVDKTLVKFIPNIVKKQYARVKASGLKVVTGYFSTQFKLMGITFVISLISLSYLKINYFLLFAIGIALIDMLPFFGSGFFLWPMIVYYLILGDYITAIILAITYVVIFFTRQFLEPRLLGDKLEVNPLLTLMAMYIGLQVIGVIGLLLGPFTLILVKHIVEHRDEITE